MFRLRRRLGLWLTALLLALMPLVAQASILNFIPTGPAGPPAQQQDKQAQFEGKFELAKVRILGVPAITAAAFSWPMDWIWAACCRQRPEAVDRMASVESV